MNKMENRSTQLSRLVDLGDEYVAVKRLYAAMGKLQSIDKIPMVRLEVEGPNNYWTIAGMPSSVTFVQSVGGRSEGLRQRDASVCWYCSGETINRLVDDGLLAYEAVDEGELPHKAWPRPLMQAVVISKEVAYV